MKKDKTVVRDAKSGEFVGAEEAAASPKKTVVEKVSRETFKVTDQKWLEKLIDAAESHAKLVGDTVDATNIYVLRYMAFAEQAREIIKLHDERGHWGIPTEVN
jgi:hypothetical protein